jgi:hypothetical protein
MKARLATMAPWCREIVLPASVLVVLAGLGFANSGTTRVAPVVERIAPSLAADVKFAGRVESDKPQAAILNADFVKTANALAVIATATPVAQEPAVTTASIDSVEATQPAKPVVVASADPTASIAPVAEASADPAAVAEASKPVVVAALTDSAEVLPLATTPEQTTQATAESGDGKANDAKPRVDTAAVLDECYVIDPCADRYLWALYERTRKEDTVKEKAQREVTVKRKGKTVTVTRTVSRVVDEDFGWKDPKAADHAGMTITDYVIGGMDHDFKLRLFRLLLAAEQAGLSPGITSAFRDNYRQSIASGLKAADDRSFHGGSLRGGYGHGLAADIVSVNGATRALRQASSEVLWNWVDKHGKDYGMGRPYHDRDPPHVGPIDGSEYVSRHAGGRSRHAAASRPRPTAVARAGQTAAERVRTANASAR